MKWALERAEEIASFGMGELDVSGIPPRRLAELSRYGVDGKASLLRRHGDSRRLATLLATAVYLTSRAVDDALDLLEVLIATKLLARAERETAKQKLKTLPRMERAGMRLATAFRVVFDTTSEQVDTDTGEISPPEVATFTAMWERVEEVVPREELAAAIAALFELAPPLDSDADEAWRSMLVTRFPTVRPFLALLVQVVDFGATPEGLPVLKALKSLPGLMGRKKVGPEEIDTSLLTGSWRRLVLSAPHLEPGMVAWKAYVFCVLETFHRMLRRREVFAKNSSKWGDPRAKLLDGEAWEQVRPAVLASLNLPGDPGEHLAARAALLHGTYREVAARVPANSQIIFDDGRLHFAALQPEPEPASLLDLRKAVEAMPVGNRTHVAPQGRGGLGGRARRFLQLAYLTRDAGRSEGAGHLHAANGQGRVFPEASWDSFIRGRIITCSIYRTFRMWNDSSRAASDQLASTTRRGSPWTWLPASDCACGNCAKRRGCHCPSWPAGPRSAKGRSRSWRVAGAIPLWRRSTL
ncbi:hypothetical protein GCM10020295_83550 [Streptomyces cinereospinus]